MHSGVPTVNVVLSPEVLTKHKKLFGKSNGVPDVGGFMAHLLNRELDYMIGMNEIGNNSESPPTEAT